jgi:CubicO group peptidase (beta-lactamase class C family)
MKTDAIKLTDQELRSSRGGAALAFGLGRSLSLILLLTISCSSSLAADSKFYFPPAGVEWEKIEATDAGWNADKLNAALKLAGDSKSSGVVVLWKGRILAEEYWSLKDREGVSRRYFGGRRGEDAAGRAIEDVASCQKSVVAILTGMARERGLIEIEKPASEYLGKGWSKASPEQEAKITVRHLLTMTSGLTDALAYQAPAGSRWRYNSTAYSRTRDAIAKGSGKSANDFTRKWLTSRIGMNDSSWAQRPGAVRDPQQNQLGFATTARDLARLGLLVLARGDWNGETILKDEAFLKEILSPSQKLNPSYGYLWWLNGQKTPAQGRRKARNSMIPNAPNDLVAANGALGRKLWVVPSLDLIVTRLGDTPRQGFDNQFWRLMMEAAPKKR